jgi:hypothetical protein
VIDPQLSDLLVAEKHHDLIREAEIARLVAQLPHQRSAALRVLALACRQLASWLDDSRGYVRTPESGPADLVSHSASL